MEIDRRTLIISIICIALGIILIVAGVITKEIEISKQNCGEIYDKSDN